MQQCKLTKLIIDKKACKTLQNNFSTNKRRVTRFFLRMSCQLQRWHWKMKLTQCLTYPTQMTTPNPTCMNVSLSRSVRIPNVSLNWWNNNTKSLNAIIIHALLTLNIITTVEWFFFYFGNVLHLNLIWDHLTVCLIALKCRIEVKDKAKISTLVCSCSRETVKERNLRVDYSLN